MIVKLATKEEGSAHLIREAHVLDLAARDLERPTNSPLPRHLGLLEGPSFTALAITAVRGRRAKLPDLTESRPGPIDRRRVQTHVNAVRAWSRSLAGVEASDQQRNGQSTAARIQKFISVGDIPVQVGARLESLASAIHDSDVRWVPCWQHGDVAPGNVLWYRRRIRLVDWEAASPRHDPWRDDAYLILSLARAVQHVIATPSVSAALLGPLSSRNWAGRILSNIYQGDWQHPIPIGWALMATTIEHALEHEERGTTTKVWRDLAIDLLCDEELHAQCDWLIPRW